MCFSCALSALSGYKFHYIPENAEISPNSHQNNVHGQITLHVRTVPLTKTQMRFYGKTHKLSKAALRSLQDSNCEKKGNQQMSFQLIKFQGNKSKKISTFLLIIEVLPPSITLNRSAHTPSPMTKEELSSTVSVQLFNGETQQLTITLDNIGSEDIESLELTSKIVSTKG